VNKQPVGLCKTTRKCTHLQKCDKSTSSINKSALHYTLLN